jgi:hypothetical protein
MAQSYAEVGKWKGNMTEKWVSPGMSHSNAESRYQHRTEVSKAAFPLVQLRSLRHASTQEDGQTIRRKHAPAAGKRQIHACVTFRLPLAHPFCACLSSCILLPLRMCHIACVVAQVETQPNPHPSFKRILACPFHPYTKIIFCACAIIL